MCGVQTEAPSGVPPGEVLGVLRTFAIVRGGGRGGMILRIRRDRQALYVDVSA